MNRPPTLSKLLPKKMPSARVEELVTMLLQTFYESDPRHLAEEVNALLKCNTSDDFDPNFLNFLFRWTRDNWNSEDYWLTVNLLHMLQELSSHVVVTDFLEQKLVDHVDTDYCWHLIRDTLVTCEQHHVIEGHRCATF